MLGSLGTTAMGLPVSSYGRPLEWLVSIYKHLYSKNLVGVRERKFYLGNLAHCLLQLRGRALASHARCREFDSRILHHVVLYFFICLFLCLE